MVLSVFGLKNLGGCDLFIWVGLGWVGLSVLVGLSHMWVGGTSVLGGWDLMFWAELTVLQNDQCMTSQYRESDSKA